jgi:hypothetical protein
MTVKAVAFWATALGVVRLMVTDDVGEVTVHELTQENVVPLGAADERLSVVEIADPEPV